MRCVQPYVTRLGAFGCGRCLPCRVQTRRTWAHRLELEASQHADKSFVTLTYAGDVTDLNPDHAQKWLKRLRRAIAPIRLRYFLVGEYGDQTERPHYHAALFGWPSCSLQQGFQSPKGCQCHACSVVRSTWGFGHVMVGRLEPKSSAYIAAYCTKKMTHRLDTRLGGRHPEFARMSLNPGIGADAMWDVASAFMQYHPTALDVPTGLQYTKTTIKPLGKYLRRELRKKVGRDKKAPPEALQKLTNQMQLLRSFAWQNDRSVSSVFEELFLPLENALAGRLKLKQGKL